MNPQYPIYILGQKPSVALNEFLILYDSIHPVDIERSRQMILQEIAHARSSKSRPAAPSPHLNGLNERWYDSLSRGTPDYGIYDDDYYFADLWACWIVYSRGYMRGIVNSETIDGIRICEVFDSPATIIDLGCGLGYATASLKQIFPDSTVVGTNLSDTKQYQFCMMMAERFGFSIETDIADVGKVDLIVATEYFEHFADPLAHLTHVLDVGEPKALYIANSFNTYSLGHFQYDQSIGKRFSETLRRYGYRQVKTTLWNNKPMVWLHES